MATKSDYAQRDIEAAKSVLIELMQILGEYREQMVRIGGWVPFFLFGPEHVGSMDVDIALDRDEITDDVYRTIRQHLEKRGYAQGDQPFVFGKEVKIDDGDPITVADFDEIADKEERDRVKRDAHERVTALLDALQISEFTE